MPQHYFIRTFPLLFTFMRSVTWISVWHQHFHSIRKSIIFYLLCYRTNICFVFQKCWVQDILVFQDVDNQPLILSAWLSGSAARHVEQLSEEEVKLEIFHFISRIMGTALNVTVPSPTLILRYCILLNTNIISHTNSNTVHLHLWGA